MRLRPPATPLITIDPYFSVWSDSDRLNAKNTVHWTGKDMSILGYATIDGTAYRFMGGECAPGEAVMEQISRDVDALTTTYIFRASGVELTALFTSPVIPDDLYYLTRPVSYLELTVRSTDSAEHKIAVKLAVSEQICLDRAGEDNVVIEKFERDGISHISMGSEKQPVLVTDGDDLRIDWGYFYLSAPDAVTYDEKVGDMTYVCSEVAVDTSVLFTFAYDDIKSIEYFGKALTSWWNRDGANIVDEISNAHADYFDVFDRCREFSDKLFLDATRAGGEKYAELLELAFRQTINGHKAAVDENGELLWISKECFSNGCAATVDVSYPSIPLFLLYNPALVQAMMRPIYRYAATADWQYDFAPHDVGRYPRLNGQVYAGNRADRQMPVEECGNMLVMEAAAAVAGQDASFAASHIEILEKWVQYLTDNGRDPENQLCTDDFAGHLAHNCNLSLKAIMGIAGLGIIYGMLGKKRDSAKYLKLAREYAADWEKRAANGDGSYRLAFDCPGSFSMKYNIVWDKLFGTGIMPQSVLESEIASYARKTDMYGLPLDNRSHYTKSDWLVWTATLTSDRDTFEKMVAPLWEMFNCTPSRVPMTDWYYTITGLHKRYDAKERRGDEILAVEKSFRNRTVQGGLFIKLLEYRGIMRLDR